MDTKRAVCKRHLFRDDLPTAALQISGNRDLALLFLTDFKVVIAQLFIKLAANLLICLFNDPTNFQCGKVSFITTPIQKPPFPLAMPKIKDFFVSVIERCVSTMDIEPT